MSVANATPVPAAATPDETGDPGPTRRVVITGLGVLAPTGLSSEAHWESTLAGRTGLRERATSAEHPLRIAGEITGFDPAGHLPSRLVPQTDRTTQLALVAAEQALRDAGLTSADIDPATSGVVTASSSGGFEFGQHELQNLWRLGADHVSAYMSFAWFYAVNSGQVAIRHDLRGPTGVVVTEQAGGIDALGQARRLVRQGADVVLTGGTDASLCPFGWAAHAAAGTASTGADPERAYLPFDRRADGHVPGEGGAMMVLEDSDVARARGARSLATVRGYAATFEPRTHRPTAMARCIEAVLADADLVAADIGAVFADAAADPAADAIESRALTAVFGARAVPVTAPKTLTGRLYSGGAALDLATAVLALRDAVLPHTYGVIPDDDHTLDLVVGEPRPWTGEHVLVLARGHGGFHAAAILSR